MYNKNIAGVYRIVINNEVYIGSSVCFNNRAAKHLWQLKKQEHDNIHLQRLYNKYQQFNIELVECCINSEDRDYIVKREQWWIDYYGFNNLTNLKPDATFGRGSEAYKAVAAIDPDTMQHVKHYKAFKHVVKDGFNQHNVSAVVRGKEPKHHGYIWQEIDAADPVLLKAHLKSKGSRKEKRISKICPDTGTVLKTYNAIKDTKEDGFKPDSTSLAARQDKLYKGFKWRLE